MCMIGTYIKTVNIPEHKALKGYRFFRGNLKQIKPLSDLNGEFHWNPKGEETIAQGYIENHNYAGLWAYKNYEIKKKQNSGASLSGVILMYGRVAIHKEGYRSSHAKIISLTVRSYRARYR